MSEEDLIIIYTPQPNDKQLGEAIP